MPAKEPTPPLKQPETLEEKVQVIVAETLTVDDEEVTLNAHVIHDLHADSLDEIEIVMRLEEEFGIEIPDDDIEKFSNVQSYVDYLRKQEVKYEPEATRAKRRHRKID